MTGNLLKSGFKTFLIVLSISNKSCWLYYFFVNICILKLILIETISWFRIYMTLSLNSMIEQDKRNRQQKTRFFNEKQIENVDFPYAICLYQIFLHNTDKKNKNKNNYATVFFGVIQCRSARIYFYAHTHTLTMDLRVSRKGTMTTTTTFVRPWISMPTFNSAQRKSDPNKITNTCFNICRCTCPEQPFRSLICRWTSAIKSASSANKIWIQLD